MSMRWRIALTFVPVVIGACWMLILDVLIGLLCEIRKASFSPLSAMIEWAGEPS